jgi:hypothetical protein
MLGKFSKKITLAVLAGVSGLVVSGTAVHAGSVDLVYTDPGTQQTYDSGWTASWDNSFDAYIDVAVDAVRGDSVYIEKFVNFTPAFINQQGNFINPAVITFQQRDVPSSASHIVLNDESLINNTGKDWNGFRMFLMGGASFDQAASADFSVNPFTLSSFTANSKELDIGGGIVANGTVWSPGVASGALWINTCGSDGAFVLKEQPQAIPLPAAAWSGISGLIGLALLGSRKKLRELVA